MSDSISRQAAIDVIRETVVEGMLADTIELRLNELPSAEKTGKWMKYEGRFDYEAECSECECSAYWKSDYCPNCGARMVNENERT